MSENYSVSKRGADQFNQKAGLKTVGWAYALPLLVDNCIDDHGLPEDVMEVAHVLCDDGLLSRPFRRAVFAYQQRHGLGADEKLGAGTWGHMLDRQEVPDFGFGHITVADMELAVPELGVPIRVDNKRYRFKAFRNGCVSRNVVVMHWGGTNVRSCYNTLVNGGLSTHIMGSPDVDEQGEYVLYQGVDLADSAFHAGRVNSNSIGIDICRSPLTKFKDRYENPKVIKNPMSGYLTSSQKRIVALPDNVSDALVHFVRWLSGLFSINYGAYPGDGPIEAVNQIIRGEDMSFTGVIGHHNVPDGNRSGKWDIAPWREIWDKNAEV